MKLINKVTEETGIPAKALKSNFCALEFSGHIQPLCAMIAVSIAGSKRKAR
ncbi:MAG: hypothetical protein AB7E31_04415 [Desulfitobacterium sp.]